MLYYARGINEKKIGKLNPASVYKIAHYVFQTLYERKMA